ncbi:hypothetical protein SAMN05443248_8934 [Bradyrhizobium erythrophlei]|jgi:hypothetical protein|uniref:Uncharacterized protein n=1 Tax=Bradyrhizobium erythrophlei TaxID=1437360 RepID=A0A1M5YXK7_9BRAD|nr:hypothetical protein SAMN05443248_8934 [Bradyrhizobium erythrophlei]
MHRSQQGSGDNDFPFHGQLSLTVKERFKGPRSD